MVDLPEVPPGVRVVRPEAGCEGCGEVVVGVVNDDDVRVRVVEVQQEVDENVGRGPPPVATVVHHDVPPGEPRPEERLKLKWIAGDHTVHLEIVPRGGLTEAAHADWGGGLRPGEMAAPP